MMIPTAALLVPNFATIRFLRLYDTIPGIALPFFGSAFATFLLRQTFLSLPRDLADAASIDGCRWDQELRHVYLSPRRVARRHRPVLPFLPLERFPLAPGDHAVRYARGR